MKVVLLVGRSTGGIGTHVAQLAADLRRGGDEVMVVAHPETARQFDFGPVLAWWPSRRGVVAAGVRRLVGGADVLHAHGHQAGLLATALTRSAGRRRPALIVSWHNAVLHGSGRLALKQRVQRWVVRRADLVSGASQDLVDEALRLGARDARLAPVPSPLVPGLLAGHLDPQARDALRSRLLAEVSDITDPGDPSHVSAVRVTRETALVLTVCRVAPQKNLPALVAAAARCAESARVSSRPDLRWVVVGGGDADLLATLQETARTTGAPVSFVGSRPDVADWLRAADVFVLPSVWEARALVVQEAMAAGLPVVAGDVGGLPELLDGTGVLVHLDGSGGSGGDSDSAVWADADALASAVTDLLADAERRQDLGRRARAAAAALPDGADAARQWHGWYAECRGRREQLMT